MSISQLKKLISIDEKIDTAIDIKDKLKQSAETNREFIGKHTKLIASYKLASTSKEEKAKFAQFRKELTDMRVLNGDDYNLLADTNYIRAIDNMLENAFWK